MVSKFINDHDNRLQYAYASTLSVGNHLCASLIGHSVMSSRDVVAAMHYAAKESSLNKVFVWENHYLL